jgi:hypothetical protein
MQRLEALSQVFKSPHQLVGAETSLVFPTSMQASENFTDVEPPGWADRDELWSIDSLLGCYDPQQRQITIFKKGIEHVAQKLALPSIEGIEYVIRIHEWGHAVVHLGVDQEKSSELTSQGLRP